LTSEPLPFEESLARLEKIVERLQRDDVPLDEAVGLFKEGTALTKRCDELLSGAELRIQELTKAVHEQFATYEAAPPESPGEAPPDEYEPL
jgi:exodeoxyribonuclease VII small subunit